MRSKAARLSLPVICDSLVVLLHFLYNSLLLRIIVQLSSTYLWLVELSLSSKIVLLTSSTTFTFLLTSCSLEDRVSLSPLSNTVLAFSPHLMCNTKAKNDAWCIPDSLNAKPEAISFPPSEQINKWKQKEHPAPLNLSISNSYHHSNPHCWWLFCFLLLLTDSWSFPCSSPP